MSVNRWHTKNDVLYDLAQVTGTCSFDLDDNYVVVGEKPPPFLISEDDDEITLRFGKIHPTQQNDDTQPDLAGITQMLRMVNDKNDENDIVKPVTPPPPEPPQERIVLSKLNPNVQEFIPKGFTNDTNDTESVVDKTKSNVPIADIQLDKESDSIISGSNENTALSQTAKLKNDITKAPKDLKGKRERTLAIVTLLKMHSTANTNESKLKLLPPDYYTKPSKPDDSIEEKQSEKQCLLDSGTNTISTPSSSLSPAALNNSGRLSPTYLESVNKVNDWLNKVSSDTESTEKVNGAVSPKPKPKPAVHLGPITFKKRNKPKVEEAPQISCSSSKSSSSLTMSPKQAASLTMSPKQAEMSDSDKEKYRKRNEAHLAKLEQDKIDRMNLWEKLEYNLKKKDEEILKKRMGEQNE